MNINKESCIEFIKEALDEIDQSYYVSINWRESLGTIKLENYSPEEKVHLLSQSKNYYERVFCYELYHQLRTIWKHKGFKTNAILQAELRKEGPKEFLELLKELHEAEGLDGVYYPDFLIHEPGTYKGQLLVMEVKTDPNINQKAVEKDIKKLDDFIDKYQYKIGIFLCINIKKQHKKRIFENESFINFIKTNINHASQISILFKSSKNAPTIPVTLDSLIKL